MEDFEKYLPYVIPMLQGAAVHCARLDHEDEDLVDLRNLLSRGIFKACTGILQGFKNKAEVVMPFAHPLLQFIEAVFKDKQMYVILFLFILFLTLPYTHLMKCFD